jgi:hypothetical protein
VLSPTIPLRECVARFSHIVQTIENIEASDEVASSKFHSPSNLNQKTEAALSEVDTVIRSKDLEATTELVTKSIISRMADMLFISVDGIDAT